MVEIRGLLINGSIAAVKKRDGDEVYNNILSQLDEQTKQLFETPISDIDWYPLDFFARFLEQDIKLTANGDENILVSRAEAVHEGRMKGVYEGFIGSDSPGAFIEHVAVLHQLYFKGVSNEIKFVGTNRTTVKYAGFERQHRIIVPTIIGFYRAVLKTAGVRDIHIKYSTSTDANEKYIELDIAWR